MQNFFAFKKEGYYLIGNDGKGDTARNIVLRCPAEGNHSDRAEAEGIATIHEKAITISKLYLENTTNTRCSENVFDGVVSTTDFTYLWSKTSPMPPTAMVQSAFSCLPLLGADFATERQQHFIYEYYIPTDGKTLTASALLLWNTFVASVCTLFCYRDDYRTDLQFYLDGSTSHCNTESWTEEHFWKLLSSLLSAVALFHSHGYWFRGDLNPRDVLCFASTPEIYSSLESTMLSAVSAVSTGNTSSRNSQEALSVYIPMSMSSIIAPHSRITGRTPPSSSFFVLTASPVSQNQTNEAEKINCQNQDLAAIRRMMEFALQNQMNMYPSSNQELRFLLRCLPQGSDGPDAAMKPSALSLLQLQALRLRQAGWMWQSLAELHHCGTYPTPQCELPNRFTTPSSRVGQNQQRQRHYDSQSVHQMSGKVAPDSRSSMCASCVSMSKRESKLEEREKKVSQILELYELTREQLDSFPSVDHSSYEELRQRLLHHSSRPLGIVNTMSTPVVEAATSEMVRTPRKVQNQSKYTSHRKHKTPELVPAALLTAEELLPTSSSTLAAAASPRNGEDLRMPHLWEEENVTPVHQVLRRNDSGTSSATAAVVTAHTPSPSLPPMPPSTHSTPSRSPVHQQQQQQQQGEGGDTTPSSRWLEERFSTLEALRQSFDQTSSARRRAEGGGTANAQEGTPPLTPPTLKAARDEEDERSNTKSSKRMSPSSTSLLPEDIDIEMNVEEEEQQQQQVQMSHPELFTFTPRSKDVQSTPPTSTSVENRGGLHPSLTGGAPRLTHGTLSPSRIVAPTTVSLSVPSAAQGGSSSELCEPKSNEKFETLFAQYHSARSGLMDSPRQLAATCEESAANDGTSPYALPSPSSSGGGTGVQDYAAQELLRKLRGCL